MASKTAMNFGEKQLAETITAVMQPLATCWQASIQLLPYVQL